MIYRFGPFELDEQAGELRRGGEPVNVQPKPLALLGLLIRERGRVVSQDELFEALWPGTAVTPSSLTRAVSHARRAIGDTHKGSLLRSIPRRGYRFVGDVVELGGGDAPGGEVRPAQTAAHPLSDTASVSTRPELFVGRGDALERLRVAWSQARNGSGRLVLVGGAPGIGKSRLCEVFAGELTGQGAVVRFGRCREGEGVPAFWLWSEVLRGLAEAELVDAAGDYDDIDYVTTGLPVDANLMSKSRQSYLSGALGIRPPGKSWTGELSVNRMISDNDNFNSGLWTGSTGADTVELRLKGGLGFGPHGAVSQHVGFALERQELDFSQRGQASPFADPNQNQSYSADSLALEYVGKPLEGLTWTLSGRLDEYSAFRNARTWQAAASYRVSASLRLRASAGTGSKTPTFTERFGYYPDLFIGNPDLKPESSRGWEIGMDSDWADGRYALQLAWYEQSLEDEIDSFVFDPVSFLYTARNKSTGSRRRGLETVFDAHLGKPLTLTASYTYTDATERDAQRRRLREVRRPKHMASVSANYRFAGGRGNLNLNLDYSGPQRDVLYSPATYTLDRVRVGAHSVLDMAVAWRLTRSLQLTARVSNLLDEDYEEIVGFRRPGRALYAGLRGRFGM